jgi:hypothetical protein
MEQFSVECRTPSVCLGLPIYPPLYFEKCPERITLSTVCSIPSSVSQPPSQFRDQPLLAISGVALCELNSMPDDGGSLMAFGMAGQAMNWLSNPTSIPTWSFYTRLSLHGYT